MLDHRLAGFYPSSDFELYCSFYLKTISLEKREGICDSWPCYEHYPVPGLSRNLLYPVLFPASLSLLMPGYFTDTRPAGTHATLPLWAVASVCF